MKFTRKIFYYLVIILSAVIIILSVLSLIHDLKFWYFKILDFPRLQYLIAAGLLFILFLVLNKTWKLPTIFLCLGLLASIFIHGQLILPYYFGEKTVSDASASRIDNENKVSILIVNVLITNKNSDELIQIIQNANADLVLAMEVNQWWVDQLGTLKNDYAYSMELPLDNSYGMALYSKFPLKDQEIAYLNQDDVPSFHTEILLSSGKSFHFNGVHPVPPVPTTKYPDNVGEKEVALIKVGKMVEKADGPAIVTGDFNDVSWSQTSRLFNESGILNNVRIGRGTYNSFNAHSYFLRWPLDHFFVTKEFKLLSLERLPKFGSDHFPMLAEFILD